MASLTQPGGLLLSELLESAMERRLRRQQELRQQVREGKLDLDEYLRVYIGVSDRYLDEVRPRFKEEIFGHESAGAVQRHL